MLPASEYSLARWKKTSTSWASSRIATLISWRFAAITNSLLMNAPTIHGENRSLKKARGRTPSAPCPGDPQDRLPGTHGLKIFQPRKAENPVSNTLPREAAPAALHETRKLRQRRTVTRAYWRGAQPNRWSWIKNPDADQKQMESNSLPSIFLKA